MRNLFMIFLFFIASFSTIPAFAESFLGTKYTIIEKSNLGNIKGSIDIRLDKKVTKDFLQKFALELRKNESKKYKSLFITYYLPGMTPGSGAWATSHFTPNLVVEILGATIDEEKSLLNNKNKSTGEIIGEWIDESLGAKYTLLKKNNKIIMTRKFKDGSSSEKEMIQKTHSEKRRFEEKKGNDIGEYYLIENNGSLGAYDNAGLISSMRSTK